MRGWAPDEVRDTFQAYLDVSWLFLQDEIGDLFRNLQRKRRKQISQKSLFILLTQLWGKDYNMLLVNAILNKNQGKS